MAENGDLSKLITDLIGNLGRELRRASPRSILAWTPKLRACAGPGLWESDRRWSAGMDDRALKIDSALEAKDREISELRKRIADIEDKLR